MHVLYLNAPTIFIIGLMHNVNFSTVTKVIKAIDKGEIISIIEAK